MFKRLKYSDEYELIQFEEKYFILWASINKGRIWFDARGISTILGYSSVKEAIKPIRDVYVIEEIATETITTSQALDKNKKPVFPYVRDYTGRVVLPTWISMKGVNTLLTLTGKADKYVENFNTPEQYTHAEVYEWLHEMVMPTLERWIKEKDSK